MELGLSGRHALVCGASRGMGRAIAQLLAKEDVDLTLVARDATKLEETVHLIGNRPGRTVNCVAADITSEQGRQHIFEACPEPDILINNGAGMPPGDFREWRREDWIRGIDTMMLAPIEMIRLAIDGMIARRFGRIVNLASRSVKSPQAEMGLSNASRSGLVAFSSGLSRQVIAHNVTINNVLPGIIDSEAQYAHVQDLAKRTGRSYADIWNERAARTPAARYGLPVEVATAVGFFCSQASGFVTGQSLLVDGGDYSGIF
ncbi:SDR family NAD(P)-dependent oxidoreductase [Acetobacter okinawensis]|uniref:SDR family NAD(P)-dependent oxidoreductase n=1 Tax=Acetobacter okinawensis TaxID=1076594 RepID=UPI0004715B29|nr:SDR family NAD(P)-dependent oxidoreductase [Acetobacter okinawensis]MBS0966795.1 SDR family oxidoreductase [Acetobacter okinawensis]MCP1212545.1 SDR family oxidoreductase [Acetobacter okinawensis]